MENIIARKFIQNWSIYEFELRKQCMSYMHIINVSIHIYFRADTLYNMVFPVLYSGSFWLYIYIYMYILIGKKEREVW